MKSWPDHCLTPSRSRFRCFIPSQGQDFIYCNLIYFAAYLLKKWAALNGLLPSINFYSRFRWLSNFHFIIEIVPIFISIQQRLRIDNFFVGSFRMLALIHNFRHFDCALHDQGISWSNLQQNFIFDLLLYWRSRLTVGLPGLLIKRLEDIRLVIIIFLKFADIFCVKFLTGRDALLLFLGQYIGSSLDLKRPFFVIHVILSFMLRARYLLNEIRIRLEVNLEILVGLLSWFWNGSVDLLG